MPSEHDKAKPWRPRLSVRTLVILVTLVCVYLACWGPTKDRGVNDVARFVCRDIGFDLAPEYSDSNIWARQMFDAGAFPPLVVGISQSNPRIRHYYFWFFGYVAKLPYERDV